MKKEIFYLVAIHEGFRAKMYKCTADKNTIGYGFNLDDTEIPMTVADFWLNYLLDDIHKKLKKMISFYDKLDEARQAVLIDMTYNLGFSGLMQFKKMLYAMEQKNLSKPQLR
jgi:lysozyme